MKKIFFNIGLLCLGMLALLVACQDDDFSLSEPPAETVAAFTYTPSTQTPNIINFTSPSNGFIKRWSFGNGGTSVGDQVEGRYPFKGTYEVTLVAYTAGGSTTTTQTITIANDDLTLVDIDEYKFLSGGLDAVEGKTWIVDREVKGHLGVGPSAGTWPEWYEAGPNEKADRGLYDDEFTFQLAGSKFTYNTGDAKTVYVNASYGGDFPGAPKEPGGNDYIAPYTPPANQTWSLSQDNGKWYLTIGNGGFMGYYSGAAPVYEILLLTPDELQVRSIQGGVPANAWYQRFIRKGFVRTPPPLPPYKIEDIFTDFEGAGNVTFTPNSGGSVVTYDNPAPVPINKTAKVGKYVKADGTGGAFSNVQIQLPYKMDLRERHVFKMKVFIPSYNDYTTVGGESWQTYNTLQPYASMKLQNRDESEPFRNQTEVLHRDLPMNEWVELTFDFNAAAANETYNTIVIQLGGEGIYTGGIFFIDDLALHPAVQ
jgi:hypothetical protein